MIDPDLFKVLTHLSEKDGIHGVVIGVVTGRDPGTGQVQLEFPWLSDNVSRWARVISPMAGPDRGLYMLPELKDEVLVAFEHGNIELPYVLGSLWNGKDTPPDGGENGVRLLKTPKGHRIRLNDTDGQEKIEIIDGSEQQRIVFDTAARTLTISADQDVVIESKSGRLKLSGQKGVEITAPAGSARLEATEKLDVKSSGGPVNVEGTLINLN